MWIKRDVVMLPTNEKSKLYLYTPKTHDVSINILNIHDGNSRLYGGNPLAQHLYILSNEEIKEGDWCLINDKHIHLNIENDKSFLKNNCKKIIATTKLLTTNINLPISSFNYLPDPSKEFIEKFIEEYNKGNIITKVMVEYINNEELRNWYHENGMHNAGSETNIINELKINPKNNTISICKIKDSWTREEVISLINKFGLALGNEIHTVFYPDKKMISINNTDKNKWIEENL